MKLAHIQGRRQFPKPLRILPGYEHGEMIARRRCLYCGRPIGLGVAFWFASPLRLDVYHEWCGPYRLYQSEHEALTLE